MKRILVLATVAAAIMSSCTKQYVDDSTNLTGSGTIGFDTYVSTSTKGVAKGGFVMGDQFFVYGGKTGNASFDVANPNNADWAYKAPNFVEGGAKVSNYGGAPSVWRYDNPVAWDESLVTFFAFSPVPDATAGAEKHGITMTVPAVNTIPKIEFEVKGGYDPSKPVTSDEANKARIENKKQVDLLWAFAANKSRVDKSVDLMFKHALTQLNFSVCSNAPTGHMIRINTIVVKNVITDGTLALAHDETVAPKPGDLGYLGGWTPKAAVKSFPVNLKNSVASLIKDNDVHAINDADEALMMIPQALANVELEVCYSYSVDGISWENYQTGTPVIVKLGSLSSHTHWNPNKAIRYILNITPGEVIGFTAKVEAWGTEGNTEFLTANPGKSAIEIQKIALKAGDSFRAVKGGWITYDDGSGVKTLKTDKVEVAADATYTFAVLDNNVPTLREDQIIISKVDGVSQTIVKVAQAPGDGTFNVLEVAGDVTTLTLQTGDKVAIPQTKAAASWVKYKVGAGAETAFAAEYTVVAKDEQFTLTVEANTGAERAAIVTVTPVGGTAIVYTIKQAGVNITPIEVEAIASKVHTGADKDVITLTKGGGAWLSITDTDGAKTLADMTANGAYTLNAAVNTTAAVRTAEFSIVSAGVKKSYTLTQKAATVEAVPVVAKGGDVFADITLAAGDYIELITESAASSFTIKETAGAVANLSGKVDAAGSYVVAAKMNATITAVTAQIVVVTGKSVKVYEPTVAAATAQPLAMAVDGTTSDNVTLAVGDKIVANAAASTWLTMDSPDGSVTSYDFATELAPDAATAGAWLLKAAANGTGTAQVESFTVVTAAGAVIIYTVTQAA